MRFDARFRTRLLLGGGLALLFLGAALAEPGSGVDVSPLTPFATAAADTRDFETLLAELEGRKKQMEAELATIDPNLDTVAKRLMARGRAYYRMVRAGLLPVGGGFDELVDHAAAVERLRAALLRDMALQNELETRKSALEAELKRVRAELAPLLVQREAMQRARSAMQQAEERRAAFERAFGSSEPPPHLAVYGANAPPDDPHARFSQMRGRLSLPLEGRTEVQTPDGASGALWLVGSRDAPVRSVFSGRVVFVGQTQHGRTVVVDHGERFFTVYASLSQLEVAQGDTVPERGRLGWALRHENRRPAIYFEIRRGQRILEAAPWLGL